MTDVVPQPTPPSDARLTAPPRRSGTRLALLFILIGAAVGFGVWWYWGKTYHLATVQPGVLYRDGNQSIRQFKNAIRKVQPKTVVCLVDDNEVASKDKPQFAQEFEYLKEQGIRLERIPIPLGGWPTSDDVRNFVRLVSQPQNQPVLVHCAQGVRRTGMMVAAYQLSVDPQHYDKEKAKAAILTFGHSERTAADVKKFIDGYDPATQTATTLPASDAKE